MAVYTDISAEDLNLFLADYDLGAASAFKGIAEGVENSNFLLDTTAGRYILTVYERRVEPGDLPFFLGLLSHLAGKGFPCPTPVADRMGERLKPLLGKPAAIVSFLPGISVRRPTGAQCRAAGEGLAWLHEAAADFPGRRANALGQSAWAPLFAPHQADAEALRPGLAATIVADLAQIAAEWPEGLPQGVTHADYFPDNVFFLGGRFGGAIDFYFAANESLAYDLAIALNAWCFEVDGSFNVTKASALIGGYESRRPLTAAEREGLPVLAHGAAMRFFLTRLVDWGSTPPGSLVRPKDPREYERRLAAHRQGLDLAGLWK